MLFIENKYNKQYKSASFAAHFAQFMWFKKYTNEFVVKKIESRSISVIQKII